ncbi:MAG: hypothetical protein LBE12_04325 [Planctomycetaceae bacterium]|jgi:hypothetical protein|nr:hypothetical protein [Planctomycetaceae bacterium]
MFDRRCSEVQPTVKIPNRTKPRTGQIINRINRSNHISPLQGLWKMGKFLIPAVALRLTAGYAFHIPSGVKSEKQKFH